MEGNRDEAEKCIGIAREALEAGNRDRALRFLGKAQKLYPTETARGEARPPPRSRGPAPSGRARTDRGARRRAGTGGPPPGGPCRLRRAGPGPQSQPGGSGGVRGWAGKGGRSLCPGVALRAGVFPPPMRDWREALGSNGFTSPGASGVLPGPTQLLACIPPPPFSHQYERSHTDEA